MLRSKTVPFPKILCQETGGKLHLCKAAQVVSDKELTVRLNHVANPDDALQKI